MQDLGDVSGNDLGSIGFRVWEKCRKQSSPLNADMQAAHSSASDFGPISHEAYTS